MKRKVTQPTSLMSDSAVNLLVPVSLKDTYKVVLTEAQNLFRGISGSIYLEKDGKLARVYSTVSPALRIDSREDGNTKRAYLLQKLIVINIPEFKKIHPEFDQKGVNSIVLLPMSYNHKCIGVLTLQSKQRAFRQEDKERMNVFGALASLKIRNAILYENISQTLKLRDVFISVASHELKTPITTLLGYIEMLQKETRKTKRLKVDWLDKVAFQSKRLSILIDQLLKVNQIKSSRLTTKFNKLNITKPLRKALLDLHFTYPRHRIKYINGQGDYFVYGNDIKLNQVFTNILNNAAKFSPPRSTIEIRLSARGSFIYVEISDQGKGISRKDKYNIFRDFYKGDHNTKEGLGLGLFISKTIITEHDGSITIANVGKDKGSKVCVKLPVYDPSGKA